MNIAVEIRAAELLLANLPGVRNTHLVGSASFMPEEAKDVDYAVLVHGSPTKFAMEHLNGFEESVEYDVPEYGTWRSYRNGDLNLIVTSDQGWFDRYVAAMETCKYLRLTDKAQRIAVCRIVRDGWPAEAIKGEDLF